MRSIQADEVKGASNLTTDRAVLKVSTVDGQADESAGVLVKSSDDDLTLFANNANKAISAGEELYECLSTGLTHWTQPCVAPVSAGASLDVTIYEWSGHAVYNTDISDANWTYAVATQTTGTYTLPGTPTNEVYWVYWDVSAGAYAHQTTEPTAAQRITDLYLARVIVRGGFVIAAVADANYVIAPSARFESYARNLGLVNIGIVFSGNASLSLARSAGSLIDITGGLYNDVDDPDRTPVAAANPVTFQHITQTAATGTNVTVISPGNYDNAGTITAIGGSNLQATVMRIYQFPSGNVRVAYGQVIYNKLADAVLAHATEAYTENPDIAGNGKLIAFLCVTKGCTDLTDTNTAKFIAAPIIGTGIGAGAASVTTLQRAYDNSGDTPEIATDATGGPVVLKEGTGTSSFQILKFVDSTDTQVGSVDGQGDASFNTLATASTLTVGSLTSGRIPYATTGGQLTDTGSLQWTGSNLAVTGGIAATTNITATTGFVKAGNGSGSSMGYVDLDRSADPYLLFREASTIIGYLVATGPAAYDFRNGSNASGTGAITCGAITANGNVKTSGDLNLNDGHRFRSVGAISARLQSTDASSCALQFANSTNTLLGTLTATASALTCSLPVTLSGSNALTVGGDITSQAVKLTTSASYGIVTANDGVVGTDAAIWLGDTTLGDNDVYVDADALNVRSAAGSLRVALGATATFSVPVTLSGSNALTVGGQTNLNAGATFSGGLSAVEANASHIDYTSGNRYLFSGPDNSTAGDIDFISISANASVFTQVLNLSNTAATFSVPIKLNNAAVAATPTPTHTITIQDSTGTTYRIPCVV